MFKKWEEIARRIIKNMEIKRNDEIIGIIIINKTVKKEWTIIIRIASK